MDVALQVKTPSFAGMTIDGLFTRPSKLNIKKAAGKFPTAFLV